MSQSKSKSQSNSDSNGQNNSASRVKSQQIIVSGVGGQGALFITKLLAETAVDLGYSVLISETHGMAQRGGIVISHLKVGMRAPEGEGMSGDNALISPLIRPGRADILLALHPDGLRAHAHYLKPAGSVFVNSPEADDPHSLRDSPGPDNPRSLNATAIATKLGSPVSANLVLLGFAVGSGQLFCTPEQLAKTLGRVAGKRLEGSLRAYEAGVSLRRTQHGE